MDKRDDRQVMSNQQAAMELALDALQQCAERDGDDPFWNDGGDGREACKALRAALAEGK